MRFFDRAALFAEACIEYGVLNTYDSSVSILFTTALVIGYCMMRALQLSQRWGVGLEA